MRPQADLGSGWHRKRAWGIPLVAFVYIYILYIHTSILYMKEVEQTRKILRGRIGTHFPLLGLGTVVRAAAMARHLCLRRFSNKNTVTQMLSWFSVWRELVVVVVYTGCP